MPVLDIDDVVLPTLAPGHGPLWTLLCDLADRHDRDWVLIGGQMVLLHALQAGRSPNRVSQDLDTVIDARVRPPAVAAFVATLHSLGFRSAGVSPDDVAHRFALGDTRIDVLVPEGVGRRAPIRTIGAAVTVEIAGGTQALARGERLPVRHGRRRALVPRPNLLGAIVIKAAAVAADPRPQRHLRDLAFLCSLVADPDPIGKRAVRLDRSLTARSDLAFDGGNALVWAANVGSSTFLASAQGARSVTSDGRIVGEATLAALGVDVCCPDLHVDDDGLWVRDGAQLRQVMNSNGVLATGPTKPLPVTASYDGTGRYTVSLTSAGAEAVWRVSGIVTRRYFAGGDGVSVIIVGLSPLEAAPYSSHLICRLTIARSTSDCFRVETDVGSLPESEPVDASRDSVFVLDDPGGGAVRIARYDVPPAPK